MSEWLTQHGGDLISLITMRLVLLPVMALCFAIRDGIKDARDGRPAFIWTILTNAHLGRALLSEGWIAVFRVIALGATLDAGYQFMVFHRISSISLVVAALLLALVPYVALRGAVDRMARRVFKAAPRSAHAGR